MKVLDLIIELTKIAKKDCNTDVFIDFGIPIEFSKYYEIIYRKGKILFRKKEVNHEKSN